MRYFLPAFYIFLDFALKLMLKKGKTLGKEQSSLRFNLQRNTRIDQKRHVKVDCPVSAVWDPNVFQTFSQSSFVFKPKK